MALGIMARKIGMTQVFVDDRAVGATVIEAEPCTVIQVKTEDTDGYDALQLGYQRVEERKVAKPLLKHFEKASVEPHRHLFEVRVRDPSTHKVGDAVGVGIFTEGEKIDVTGMSRGLGFQGVVKRWDFAGGPRSHGSCFHRRPGSVGCCVEPGRILKGKKLPGHTGNRQATVRGLQVLRVDPERNLLVVKGGIPGSRGGLLHLRKCHE